MVPRWMIIALVIMGVYYFVQSRKPKPAPPPPILGLQTADESAPIISEINLGKVRESAKDGDPAVRWAAIELLYSMHDPQAPKILEEALTIDSEPVVRKNAINLLRRNPKMTRAKDLIVALRDPEKDIRIAALIALGDLGDTRVIPQVTQLLSDVESDVRLQALHTLNRFQEQKRTRYKKLTEDLRKQYNRSIRKRESSRPLLPLGQTDINP